MHIDFYAQYALVALSFQKSEKIYVERYTSDIHVTVD